MSWDGLVKVSYFFFESIVLFDEGCFLFIETLYFNFIFYVFVGMLVDLVLVFKWVLSPFYQFNYGFSFVFFIFIKFFAGFHLIKSVELYLALQFDTFLSNFPDIFFKFFLDSFHLLPFLSFFPFQLKGLLYFGVLIFSNPPVVLSELLIFSFVPFNFLFKSYLPKFDLIPWKLKTAELILCLSNKFFLLSHLLV